MEIKKYIIKYTINELIVTLFIQHIQLFRAVFIYFMTDLMIPRQV